MSDGDIQTVPATYVGPHLSVDLYDVNLDRGFEVEQDETIEVHPETAKTLAAQVGVWKVPSFASGAAAEKANELGVDLAQVEGSGSGGTITVNDVVEAGEKVETAEDVEADSGEVPPEDQESDETREHGEAVADHDLEQAQERAEGDVEPDGADDEGDES